MNIADIADRTLAIAEKSGATQSEVYAIRVRIASMYIDDNIPKIGGLMVESGIGLKYIIGKKIGFTSSTLAQEKPEDVVGGGVQCSALKGYIIKNGELTQLVRSMTLAGKVLDILKTVDAVGNKLSFSGGGTCGKGEEDFISVSTGGPHMRAEMVVGGG